MRAISKRHEPPSLTEHRSSPSATYGNYTHTAELTAELVAEQRGLCCYCLSRIRADDGSARVEHWHCQADYPGETLDYSNLLAVCRGTDGQPSSAQHCDRSKGQLLLSRNPANPGDNVEEVIRFSGDGTIISSDPGFDREINDVLHLNLKLLKNNRQAVLVAFTLALPRRGAWTRTALEKELRKWKGESTAGPLQPYCQVIVDWIRRRLRRVRR